MAPSVLGATAPTTSHSPPYDRTDATFSTSQSSSTEDANTTPHTGKVVTLAAPDPPPAAPDPPLDGRTLNPSYYDGSANETAAAAIPKPLTAAVNTDGESSQPPALGPLPALPHFPPVANSITTESNHLLTQPMDFEQILGNYTNTSFNLDTATFPETASFGDLSYDAALLRSLKSRRIRTSSCHPVSNLPPPASAQGLTKAPKDSSKIGGKLKSWKRTIGSGNLAQHNPKKKRKQVVRLRRTPTPKSLRKDPQENICPASSTGAKPSDLCPFCC